MRAPVYDPINGDVGAMFPPNRSGVLPPSKGAPVVGDPMGGGMQPNPGMAPNPDDLQRQAIVKALTAKIGMGAQPPMGVV